MTDTDTDDTVTSHCERCGLYFTEQAQVRPPSSQYGFCPRCGHRPTPLPEATT